MSNLHSFCVIHPYLLMTTDCGLHVAIQSMYSDFFPRGMLLATPSSFFFNYNSPAFLTCWSHLLG
ncbi:hypothetical protein I7I50_11373 [Histoplasma capsulatum G186AR]|uniref:Uncharacterized protein n=1 Tax=Ajellomyces capsulatus TaxID=5037 RepID=A0A8H8D7X6_AJECA|nr:hypothetical protein I7I52_02611 [Histoplasma capsulatum]QSS69922.1 hypothetical protein I7I50_11373 [Histoplasma capsulatum G186AR]